MNPPEISVVILCYRAGKRIYHFVGEIERLLDRFIPSWEIILVGNYLEGSNDETPEVVKEIASRRNNITYIALPKKGMMGWDVRTGLSMATGNYISFIDGDEQMPPEDILRVYNRIKEDNLDLVKTHRVTRYDGVMRRIISICYNCLFLLLFPGPNLWGINSKPKIFKREAYNKLCLTSNNWFIDAEIMIQARRLKFKMRSLPTRFYRCPYRPSFVDLKTILEFINNLIIARIKEFYFLWHPKISSQQGSQAK